MSAPPGTTSPAPTNTSTFLLGGAVLGTIVLCGGLFAQSLITLNIVTRHADYAFKPGATRPSERPPDRTPPDSRPDPVDGNQGATEVARGFLKSLQTADYGGAYARTTDNYKNQEDRKAFEDRMEQLKIFRAYQTLQLSRTTGGREGSQTIRGMVKGPYGEGRFVMELAREDDAAWRVDSFSRE